MHIHMSLFYLISFFQRNPESRVFDKCYNFIRKRKIDIFFQKFLKKF